MRSIDTVIIGAGQAGLAMSHCLSGHGRDHVVLERGRLAERWRSERWDSMRLLSPNWMTRLPGWRYRGPDPDGFMTAGELAHHLQGYAAATRAPVVEGTTVTSLVADGARFRVETDDGAWSAADVVVATGWCDRPAVPSVARGLARDLHQVTPDRYRNPAQLPAGGVLVVGASATGVQLAAELNADGRDVVLAVGSHVRLPRTYRGMDILWWLDRMGNFDHTIDDMADAERTRRRPSLQLAGRTDRRTLDLPTLQDHGVQLAGRVTAIDGARVALAADLGVTTAACGCSAATAARRRSTATSPPTASTPKCSNPIRRQPCRPSAVVDQLDLRRRGIHTVVWATGHRRTYPWLRLPVLDAAGEIGQARGVTVVARVVRPRPALPALPQLGLHRRRRAGRGHGRRPPRRAHRPVQGGLVSGDVGVDAVVVGGRAAGAATAFLLARQGLRVVVLERGRYGADTLSTHALMRGGVLQLRRWGLLDDIVAAGTPPVRWTTFTFARQRITLPVKHSHGVDALYAPRRTVLDRLLVDAAIVAGAEVRHGVSRVRRRPRARTDGSPGSSPGTGGVAASQIDAGIVIGADGVRSTVADRVGARFERVGTGASAVVYGYWADLPHRRVRVDLQPRRVRPG